MRLGTLARLFGWLSHLCGESRDRFIFGFWDGARWRRVDPMVIYRAIDSDAEFNARADAMLIDAGDGEAQVRGVAMVRRVFGVPEFDGHVGLTEAECIALLIDFWEYVGDIKKKASLTPISPQPTEPESSPPPEELPTNSFSDCGCVSTERTDADLCL